MLNNEKTCILHTNKQVEKIIAVWGNKCFIINQSFCSWVFQIYYFGNYIASLSIGQA